MFFLRVLCLLFAFASVPSMATTIADGAVLCRVKSGPTGSWTSTSRANVAACLSYLQGLHGTTAPPGIGASEGYSTVTFTGWHFTGYAFVGGTTYNPYNRYIISPNGWTPTTDEQGDPCIPGYSYDSGSCIEDAPPPPACEIPFGEVRYQLVTDPPTLNYSPDPDVCYSQCTFDYEDSYFFDNGAIENRYSNNATPCDVSEETPFPVPGFSATPTPPDPETDCYNVLGYVGSTPVCGDAADSCAATGGAYGFIQGQEVCVPQDESPPTCAARTIVFLDESGSYVCQAPDDPVPQSGPTPDDVDGDGVSNALDTDDDGDGIPDSSDTDADGDGAPDADADSDGTKDYADADDDGDGVDDSSDVDNGGDGIGDCDPTAKGYASCVGQLSSVAESLDDQLEIEANKDGASAGTKILNAGVGAIGNGDSGMDGPTGLAGDLSSDLLPSFGACSDIDIPFQGSVMTLSCSRTEPFRDVFAWFIAALTFLYVFELAIQKGPN